jgi:hypothetical protein
LALFIAIGLNPVLEWLTGVVSRGLAVIIVTLGFVLVVVAFVLAAAPPISHEVHSLITNYPRYKADLASGKGWAGKLVVKLHLTSYLKGKSKLKIPAGGVFGAGRALLSIGVATISIVALTIYFLIALPGVKKLWLSMIPRSRRERVARLTDEVFDRVGGFMLGNLVTSVISGVGTYVWLLMFGVPYAAPRPCGGAIRPHTHGRFYYRRGHRLSGGPDQGSPDRDRHGRLLHRLSIPGGLSPQSTSDETHREGDTGPYDHHHAHRRHPPGHRRGPDRHPDGGHRSPAPGGGCVSAPKPAMNAVTY